MTEPLDLFATPAENHVEQEPENPMTAGQRNEIRSLFAALKIATAREQFDLVDILIGVQLKSVADLDAKSAAALIPRLQKRVDSHSRTFTGDSWSDREGDTWIDNL